jgi:hypothetical protein
MSFYSPFVTFSIPLSLIKPNQKISTHKQTMFAQLIVVLSVLALAIADPVKPTMPSQYMVTDINMVMDTNAGYPPHYTEEGKCVHSIKLYCSVLLSFPAPVPCAPRISPHLPYHTHTHTYPHTHTHTSLLVLVR